MPYFTVVIPTYNRANRITKAIDSLCAQEFEDWELIVVDDGSTDNTKEKVNALADARVHYLYQENAERGAARNKGTALAKGKYVFFLDSDDFIYPTHLAHAYEELQRLNEPEFFHIRYKEVFENKTVRKALLQSATIKEKTSKQNRFACQFFLRTDIANQIQFSENRDLKIGEDWGVILRVSARHTLHFSNQHLGAIVQHGERSMQVADVNTILKSRDILLRYLKEDELITQSILDSVEAELTSLAALAAAINQDKKLAKQLLSKAIQRKPYLRWTKRTLAIYKKIALG